MNPEGGSDFALVQIQGQPPVCSATMDKVPNKEKPNLAIIYLVFESIINQINWDAAATDPQKNPHPQRTWLDGTLPK